MLFADVVGFSKLPDSAYPAFLSVFLVQAAAILDDATHKPLLRNTWGDAIFAVFEAPREAANAALALQTLVQGTDWRAKLGSPLKLRIGLHAGPVHQGQDAVSGTPNFIGRHVNLAARLEPIAEEGNVYVSGEFAALATLEGAGEFQFDYVGQRPLPKGAGVIPVYRLLAVDNGAT
jgi:class 3 adenylate cyclase